MNSATANATLVEMPRLSDSMEEGTILTWLLGPGDEVAQGDDLVEIETDKANMTVQAEGSGILEIVVEEGATAPVGATIARLGSADSPAPPVSGGAPDAVPTATAEPVPAPEPAPTAAATGPAPARDGVRDAAPAGTPAATPLARRAAGIHGLDLNEIRPASGARGRITKADVLLAAGVQPQTAPPPSAPVPTPIEAAAVAPVEGAKGGAEIREPNRLQAVIARRMAEAKATVPHFQVETEVRMDAAISLRATLKEVAGDAPAPSFNDLIVKAAATALKAHPKANGSYRDGRFELHPRINVGIAVAAADALLVPVIADADIKSVGEIGRESRRLAERVRFGEVTPPELAGGTFTVSNLGMFGMTAINPVINVPQAAILGVGMTRQILVRGDGGEIEDASLMTLTLSCDHRILYGAEAAGFLSQIKRLLEEPLAIVL